VAAHPGFAQTEEKNGLNVSGEPGKEFRKKVVEAGEFGSKAKPAGQGTTCKMDKQNGARFEKTSSIEGRSQGGSDKGAGRKE